MSGKQPVEIREVSQQELLAKLAEGQYAEHRRDPRVAARLEVEVSLSWEQLRRVYTDNISKGGLMFSIEPPVTLPAAVNLTIRLPEGKTIELGGEIRHVEPSQRENARDVGVQFKSLDPAVEAELTKLLSSLA
jgi:c-di-GMP-binding flagellar brake protein YcgR